MTTGSGRAARCGFAHELCCRSCRHRILAKITPCINCHVLTLPSSPAPPRVMLPRLLPRCSLVSLQRQPATGLARVGARPYGLFDVFKAGEDALAKRQKPQNPRPDGAAAAREGSRPPSSSNSSSASSPPPFKFRGVCSRTA
jgi:hypothetical protein